MPSKSIAWANAAAASAGQAKQTASDPTLRKIAESLEYLAWAIRDLENQP